MNSFCTRSSFPLLYLSPGCELKCKPVGGMLIKKAVGGIRSFPPWDAQTQTSGGDRPNQWGKLSAVA